MTTAGSAGAPDAGRRVKSRGRLRTALIVVESAFVLGLLVIWLASPSLRHSKSLWVLFFYCLPSQFVLAALPHEPVILFFGKFYPAWVVALTATAGTLITEVINYTIFESLADLRTFQRICRGRLVCYLAGLFRKAPFPTLWIAGLTPVPFYPFRFLVAMTRYPLPLYALAVALSRFPRFFLLAFLGRAFAVPNGVIIGLFVALLIPALVPFVRERSRRSPAEEGQPPVP
ncbi:MAG TPA: VTT domain-containing protein [Terriglobales bacterium]|nr:VTT domain-containing protein [Terriglobales bacterium]